MVVIAIPVAQAARMGLLRTLPAKGGAPQPAEQHNDEEPQNADD